MKGRWNSHVVFIGLYGKTPLLDAEWINDEEPLCRNTPPEADCIYFNYFIWLFFNQEVGSTFEVAGTFVCERAAVVFLVIEQATQFLQPPFRPTGWECLMFLVGYFFSHIFDRRPTQCTSLWSSNNVWSSAKVTAAVDTGIRLIYNIASPTFLFHPVSNKYCEQGRFCLSNSNIS